MSAYEAVLFDMDGVTVETVAAWRRIEQTETLPAATNSGAPADTIRALSVADAYARLAAMEGDRRRTGLRDAVHRTRRRGVPRPGVSDG